MGLQGTWACRYAVNNVVKADTGPIVKDSSLVYLSHQIHPIVLQCSTPLDQIESLNQRGFMFKLI